MAIDIRSEFEEALRAPDATLRLRATVEALLDQGWTREKALAALADFRLRLERSGRSKDEDVVLEVLDFVTGWASPLMKL
jgi:hypothetical protein